jgi:plasmid maintenance system antidote protein VapI
MGLKDRTRIERWVREKQPVTADTAPRFARVFCTTPQFWINLQTTHDLSIAAIARKDDLAGLSGSTARSNIKNGRRATEVPEPREANSKYSPSTATH